MSVMNGSIKIVDSNKDGQRIDNFLITYLKGVPKSLIYRLLRTRKIRVNGKRIKQTYRLKVGDEIIIPDLRLSSPRSINEIITDNLRHKVESSILHEDDDLIVVNKPAGLAVHSGTRVSYGVIEILRDSRSKDTFLELAHRLDRQTSGCLLIAKNKQILATLHRLLREQKVSKEYIALLRGRWDLNTEIINTPIVVKNKSELLVKRSDKLDFIKEAETRFYLKKYYKKFSLMNVKITTGRTHQIRIHAAEAGHPIVGDRKYGDFETNRECKKLGLNRMFLHAAAVSFQLKEFGRELSFFAPIDVQLKAFLDKLSAA